MTLRFITYLRGVFMAHEEILKQLAIERQKRNSSNSVEGLSEKWPNPLNADSEHRYAWEYELEAYRKQQRKLKWYGIGALCGIISLLIELGVHGPKLYALVSSLLHR